MYPDDLPCGFSHRARRAPPGYGLAAALLLAVGGAPAAASDIVVGVLSPPEDGTALRAWMPTAEYLSAALPGHGFRILPLGYAEVVPAVSEGRLDFVLVNPAIYANLAATYRVSRIATLRNRVGGVSVEVFGGVVFSRADRTDLSDLNDLKGRSIAAVDPGALGGFQMALGELVERGLDPRRGLVRSGFAGTQDDVVRSVLRGDYDAGTVRTGVLERLESQGVIRLSDLRILSPREDPDFPLLHSTRLYPEWPFGRLRHTPDDLAQRTAIALLAMPQDHPAAVAGGYAGWSVPLDYHPVHELLRRLGLPPYDRAAPLTLRDAVARWWPALIAGAAALLAMALVTAWALRLNKGLVRAKARLEQQQELILNSVAEGIFGVDLAGRIAFVNRPLLELTGWRAEELIGRDGHALLHHSHGDGRAFPAEECPIRATFRESRACFVDDDSVRRKDGTRFAVEYSSTPVRDERGATVGAVVVLRDVTEREEAKERTRSHESDLAHVARLSTLGEMASGIAHELNQPLTAIATNARACVRLLESERGGERCGDVLERIAAQAERAGEIVNQIRHFVRKEPPELKPTRLGPILETVVGLLRPEARRAAIELSLHYPDGDLWVLAQAIQIEQVLLNLARNAIEAMTDASEAEGARTARLDIRARRVQEDRVELEVRDTGAGISPAIADRLFEPFVTTKPNGMGLGLSIGARIVEAHGSRLVVTTAPGSGASFRFTLSAVPPP